MKILVGVKMVPSPDAVAFSPGLNRIVRDDVDCQMNPSDRTALVRAVALRDAAGGEVVACTMGPPQASAVLAEAGRLGADRGLHLVDMRFSGADTLATARALAQVCRTEQPDVVMFGRVAIDGGTAQVPAQVAELAGYPMLSDVDAVEVDQGLVRARRITGRCVEEWLLPLPVVISVDPSWTLPVIAKDEEAARPARAPGSAALGPRAETHDFSIESRDAGALGGDEAGYGIRGSATYVQQVTDTASRTPSLAIADPYAAAEALWAAATAATTASTQPAEVQLPPRPVDRQLWAVVDGRDGDDAITFAAEAIACARQVCECAGALVVAVVLGPTSDMSARLAAAGADRVLIAHTRSATTSGDPDAAYAELLARLIAARSPIAVIGTWTQRGRQCMARAAARLSAGLTGDFVGLDCSTHPVTGDAIDLVWLKPAWAGTATARVVARTPVAMGTLRPGAVRPLPRVTGRIIDIEEVDIDTPLREVPGDDPVASRAPGIAGPTLITTTRLAEATIAPDVARVVICAGAGAASLIRALRDLASLAGWALGGTAEAVRLGLVPARDVIDIARCSLAPSLAIGIGLGGPQDAVALRGAGQLAIIDEAGSPLHSGADLAVTCTPLDVVTALCARANVAISSGSG